MTERVEIRVATPGEYELVGTLAREIWPVCFARVLSPAQIEYMVAQRYIPAAITEAVAKGMTYDLIRSDGHPVGFGAHGPSDRPDEWKLWQIYILPGEQGRGLGSKYIEHVATQSKAANRSTLVLTVNRGNAAAFQLYLKRGFQLRESIVIDIGNGFFMDDHVLERRLSISSDRSDRSD